MLVDVEGDEKVPPISFKFTNNTRQVRDTNEREGKKKRQKVFHEHK